MKKKRKYLAVTVFNGPLFIEKVLSFAIKHSIFFYIITLSQVSDKKNNSVVVTGSNITSRSSGNGKEEIVNTRETKEKSRKRV